MTKFKSGARVEFIPDAEGKLDSNEYTWIPHPEGIRGVVFTEKHTTAGYVYVKWDKNVVSIRNNKVYYTSNMCFKERSLKLVKTPVDNFIENGEE